VCSLLLRGVWGIMAPLLLQCCNLPNPLPSAPPPTPTPLQLQCFCQNAAQPLPRCRRPDSTQLPFPEACPEGDVLMPLPDFTSGGEVEGMPLHVEPHAASQSITSVSVGDCTGCTGCSCWFRCACACQPVSQKRHDLAPSPACQFGLLTCTTLSPNLIIFPQTLYPAHLAQDQMLLRPSAAILWPKCASTPPDPSAPDNSRVCLKEGREGGSAVLSVPPSLIDTHLLPLLEPYQKVRAH